MSKKIITFYFVFGIGLEFFRTFSMASFSPYYLHIGFTYEQIAFVKAIQLLAWFIIELPAGYLADRFGRLRIFKYSIFTFGLSFLLISLGTFQWIVLGEFLYGVSFALNSGTIIGDLNSKLEQKQIHLNPAMFFARYGIAVQTFTLFGGNIGAFLFSWDPKILFVIPALGMLLLYLATFFYKIPDSHTPEYKDFNLKICIDILKQKQLFLFFLLSGFFIASSQIIYNYWAILFQDINLSYLFSFMMIFSISGSKLLKCFFDKNVRKTLNISFALYITPLLLIGILENKTILLVLFLISQFGRGMMFIEIAKISNLILYEKSYKSTVLSMNGTTTRILSCVFLLLTSQFFNFFSIQELWSINAISLIIVFLVFNKYFKYE